MITKIIPKIVRREGKLSPKNIPITIAILYLYRLIVPNKLQAFCILIRPLWSFRIFGGGTGKPRNKAPLRKVKLRKATSNILGG